MGLFGINFGKMFAKKGSGGIEANTKRAEAATQQADLWTKPVKSLFANYLQGNAGMESLPGFMQTPDWRTTSQELQQAYGNAGYKSLADMMRQNTASALGSQLRRGLQQDPGSLPVTDWQMWYENQLAKNRADAMGRGLEVGGQLRNEEGVNYWNMLKTVADTTNAQNYGNVAQGYGQLGNSSVFPDILNTLASLGGAYYGGGFKK